MRALSSSAAVQAAQLPFVEQFFGVLEPRGAALLVPNQGDQVALGSILFFYPFMDEHDW